jgi:hypothetical protein
LQQHRGDNANHFSVGKEKRATAPYVADVLILDIKIFKFY